MAGGQLSNLVIALIIFTTITSLLVGAAISFPQSYGQNLSSIVGNDTSPGSVNATISALNIQVQTENAALNSTTYAPGQPNAQVQSGSNIGSSLQQSGLTTALKYASLLYTVPSGIIFTLGGFFGLPFSYQLTQNLIIVIEVATFIAGLIFFRSM